MRGNIVIFGAASGSTDPVFPNVLMKRSLTVSGGSLFNYILNARELMDRANAVMKGIQERWLKLRMDQVFQLEKAPDAH